MYGIRDMLTSHVNEPPLRIKFSRPLSVQYYFCNQPCWGEVGGGKAGEGEEGREGRANLFLLSAPVFEV